jgi:hypothetical protein
MHKIKINCLEKNGETIYILYQKMDYEKQILVTVQERERLLLGRLLKVTEESKTHVKKKLLARLELVSN